MIWAVIQAKRFRESEAKVEILRRGFRVFLPMIQINKRIGAKIEQVLVPRIAPFLFAEFDPREDDWESLSFSDGKVALRSIVKVWCNAKGEPRPVPIKAIQLMQDYAPQPEKPDEPIVYTEGQAVNVYLAAGRPQPGIFMGYDRGKLKVEVWILGREHVIPVPENAIEPMANSLTNEEV